MRLNNSMINNALAIALSRIISAVRKYSLVGMPGWQDVRQRYRRSALGSFWLTISVGVIIGAIDIVFCQIFKSPMQEFLLFLAVGMIIWAFVSSFISKGCARFNYLEGINEKFPIPLFLHILRMIWRYTLIIGHNARRAAPMHKATYSLAVLLQRWEASHGLMTLSGTIEPLRLFESCQEATRYRVVA